MQITSVVLKRFLRLCGLALLLLFGSGQLRAQTAAPNLPPGDGKELVALVCTQCHGLRPVFILRYGPAAWKKTVEHMVVLGAELLPDEVDTVTQYLAKNFGPNLKRSGTPARPLPAGAGKELIESRCATCHDLSKIVAPRRTREDWQGIVKAMVKLGTEATPQEMETMTSYLSAQFGEKAR